MMVRIKELQRRLDQTLGKPGSYNLGSERRGGSFRGGSVKQMTIGTRLCRMENQVNPWLCDVTGLMININPLRCHRSSTSWTKCAKCSVLKTRRSKLCNCCNFNSSVFYFENAYHTFDVVCNVHQNVMKGILVYPIKVTLEI